MFNAHFDILNGKLKFHLLSVEIKNNLLVHILHDGHEDYRELLHNW